MCQSGYWELSGGKFVYRLNGANELADKPLASRLDRGSSLDLNKPLDAARSLDQTVSFGKCGEPTIAEPTIGEPTIEEPTIEEPTIEEPTIAEHNILEPGKYLDLDNFLDGASSLEQTVPFKMFGEPTIAEPRKSLDLNNHLDEARSLEQTVPIGKFGEHTIADPRNSFFRVGRVFKMLWHESQPSGAANALRMVGKGLSDYLLSLLQWHSVKETTAILKALQLVAIAFRPLKLCELVAAMSTDIAFSYIGCTNKQLLDGFLQSDENGYIGFCDENMRSFVLSTDFQRQYRLRGPQEVFAAICIEHLRCEATLENLNASRGIEEEAEPGMVNSIIPTANEDDSRREFCDLREYATCYWDYHYTHTDGKSQYPNFLLHQAILSCLPARSPSQIQCTNRCRGALIVGLEVAASHDFLTLGRTYIEMGAVVRPCSHSNHTPLHTAAANSSHEMMKLLLDYGADPNTLAEGISVGKKCQFGHGNTIASGTLLRCNINATKDKHCWCSYCCKCAQGQTPLHLAVVRGGRDIINILLASGADMGTKTKVYGETALHIAAKHGNIVAMECLVRSGADHLSRNLNGETALELVSEGLYDDFVKILNMRARETELWHFSLARDDEKLLGDDKRDEDADWNGTAREPHLPPKLGSRSPESQKKSSRRSDFEYHLPQSDAERPMETQEDWVYVSL